MRKKILSIILALTMILSVIPFAGLTAFAENGYTTVTEFNIPVSAKLADTSPIPSSLVDCTFELMQDKKVIGGNTIFGANPMPASTTLTLHSVGKETVSGEWTIPLSENTDCGTYYYKVVQTTTAPSYYVIDDGVWYVTVVITENEAKVITLNYVVDEKQVEDENNFTLKKQSGVATKKSESGVTTLTLGGNAPVDEGAYNTAVIKSDFTIDFTKDFEINGHVTASSTWDGSFIGFVPGDSMPDPLPGGGTMAAYERSEFGNSIVFEFDTYGNGNEGKIGDAGYGREDKHFALMKTDSSGTASIVNSQIKVNANDDGVWDTNLPYTITLDTKGTSSTSDDVLTFNINNGAYNWSYTNPTAQFGKNVAYFLMGGALRYGPKDWVGTLPHKTEISFESFKYMQKITVTAGEKMLFTNTTNCITSWAALQAAINAAGSAQTVITLTQDLTASSSENGIQIPKNADIVIDLNGKTLNRNLNSAVNNGYVIYNNGKLTIQDSAAYTDESGNYISGKITGGKNKNAGGGVQCEKGSTLIMHGGSITNCTSCDGGGIMGWDGATITMDGGTIHDNTVSGTGAGIAATVGSTITVSGGEIYSNTSTSTQTNDHGGGAIGVWTNCTINISGDAKIYDNKANLGGAIATCNASKLNMQGGSIFGNTATVTGGAFNSRSNGDCFTMTGGSITDNISAGNGGGLNCNSNTVVTLGGTAVITGNKKGDVENNVYLPSDKTVILGTGDNAPKDGMKVGVTMANGTGVFTNANDTDYSDKFSADDTSKVIKYNADKKLEIVKAHTHTKGTSYMTDGKAHWLTCAGEDCPLKTVEDYLNAFADDSTGAALKEALGYKETVDKGGLMGRQGLITDNVLSQEKGRTIIGLTEQQLESIGDTVIVKGADGAGKEVEVTLDCAYTYFYDTTDGTTKKITAESLGVDVFIIIDNNGSGNTIDGYGYYRLYNSSLENFMFDVLFINDSQQG